MQNVANIFEVEPDILLTSLLVYKLNVNGLSQDGTDTIGVENKREHIVCLRQLSKEKYRDVMLEWIEDLEYIKNLGEAKDKIAEKITKIESKLLDKMELMKTINNDEFIE